MILGPEACREHLVAADRAFLATTGEDLHPHIVPITFVLTGDQLVFAVDQKPKTTRSLRRLANLGWNPQAAVLCDRYDADWTQLWWVRADGHATVSSDGPLTALAAKYPQYAVTPPAGPFVTITIDNWTGWSYS
ncbi:TIGR03668 family PPOX class F420-dependent oxidoreductase [Kribbella qitaiheensis]|uniref:TIGR03668 family PPOX class F420-dependent oxidoreductase n=1 Tax=Kribbella qitaiheensis TaxID=1544730 RepID=A0A7G6WZ83_9ACTN|nr:TIGR03668 family PPOX class F420-dependent oxidoreductase [Kribbella qitaiheensis]QNE19298.1 TIGR03668 family PPOX class F420-dependent oxidoreductase [Kribbella qitaiheensis]